MFTNYIEEKSKKHDFSSLVFVFLVSSSVYKRLAKKKFSERLFY